MLRRDLYEDCQSQLIFQLSFSVMLSVFTLLESWLIYMRTSRSFLMERTFLHINLKILNEGNRWWGL